MKGKKPADPRAVILKDLFRAVEQVDDKGLLFLLRQAQILVYNANVDRVNAQAEGRGKAEAHRGVETTDAPVRIEENNDGRSFIVSMGEARNALSRAELQRLVQICYAAESKSEALRQLFAHLKRERNDVLFDARIGGADSPLLDLLFREIRAKFQLKDR